VRLIDPSKKFNYDSNIESYHHGINNERVVERKVSKIQVEKDLLEIEADTQTDSWETLFKIIYQSNEEQKKKGLDQVQENILLTKIKKVIELRIKNFKEIEKGGTGYKN
jgi:hypothetical protein